MMEQASPVEIFKLVSKHLGNRESIDTAMSLLLSAYNSAEKSHLEFERAVELLRGLATNYALCSQVFLNNIEQYNNQIYQKYASEFADNIAALSYLNGTLEAISSPGIFPKHTVINIKGVLASLVSQKLYAHFDTEKKVCQALFSPDLKEIKMPEGNAMSSGLMLFQGRATAERHRNSSSF